MQNEQLLFIDTSTYIKTGYNFTNGSLQVVREYCETGIVQLLISNIVIMEVQTHI